MLNASNTTLETIKETVLSNNSNTCKKDPPLRQNSSACHFMLASGGLQVRRAGALAVTKAMADKQQLDMLDFDANEIPDSAIDDIKVRHLTYALLLDWHPLSKGLLCLCLLSCMDSCPAKQLCVESADALC